MDTTTYTISGSSATVIPFTGTAEQALANFETHYFDSELERCVWCDSRPWWEWAKYPCGEADKVVTQRVRFVDGTIAFRRVTIIDGEETDEQWSNTDFR